VKSLRRVLMTNPPAESLNLRNNGGNTSLLMATIGTKEKLCSEIVALLIDAKVDLDVQNKLGTIHRISYYLSSFM